MNMEKTTFDPPIEHKLEKNMSKLKCHICNNDYETDIISTYPVNICDKCQNVLTEEEKVKIHVYQRKSGHTVKDCIAHILNKRKKD